MPAKIKKNEQGLAVPRQRRSKDYLCTMCGKIAVETAFYNSFSMLYKSNNNKLPICKNCINDIYHKFMNDFDEDINYTFFLICRLCDFLYDEVLVNAALEQQQILNSDNPVKIYIQKLNSLQQYKGKTFNDSAVKHMRCTTIDEEDVTLTGKAKENQQEVIRLMAYDPFEDAKIGEKPFLYNAILSYLDSETLNDNFKISSVIEIVKTQLQLENCNKNLNKLIMDDVNIDKNSAKIKVFTDIKKSLNKTMLDLASASKITLDKQGSGTKGSGTVSEIVRILREKKIKAADPNFYDIKTAEAMKQVADISAKAIFDQINLGENDYIEMIQLQRDRIVAIQNILDETQEKYRLELIKTKELEKRLLQKMDGGL